MPVSGRQFLKLFAGRGVISERGGFKKNFAGLDFLSRRRILIFAETIQMECYRLRRRKPRSIAPRAVKAISLGSGTGNEENWMLSSKAEV
jgi:hypothetical protein